MKKYKQKQRYHSPHEATLETTVSKYERLSARIENDPAAILKLKNPTIGLKKLAIRLDCELLSHYDDDIKLCLYAITQDKANLQYISDLSDARIQEYLIQNIVAYAGIYWVNMPDILSPITQHHPSFFNLENVTILIKLLQLIPTMSFASRDVEFMRACRAVASHDAGLLMDYYLL